MNKIMKFVFYYILSFITVFTLLGLSTSVHSEVVVIEFTDGIYTPPLVDAVYVEDGFTFSVPDGNHTDAGPFGASAFGITPFLVYSWHNGGDNAVFDNDVTLDFDGAAFNLISLDIIPDLFGKNQTLPPFTIDIVSSKGIITVPGQIPMTVDINWTNISSVTMSINDAPTCVVNACLHDGAIDNVVLNNTPTVNLAGTVENASGTDLCALVLASGKFMFSCNPNGPFSLTDLPLEDDDTVKRQIYVDGFFPEVDVLQDSVDETVVMTRASFCPDYNSFPNPSENPGSAGERIEISGTILLQDTQTPVCAIVLANGQFTFSCDGSGQYALDIPLDSKGQFKLQVYADGFAPLIQVFDEFQTTNNVRLARDVECQ